MAEKRATLILELKDLASKGLDSVRSAFSGLTSSIIPAGLSIAGLTAFLADSFKAFSASEVSVNKLNIALKNQGFYSDAYAAGLRKMALELQDTTTFSDEAVMETQALLTTFGLAGKELERTTKAALDLSTGLGIDLRSATLLLGKAFVGETQTLARYGIQVNDSLGSADKFASILDSVHTRFGGAAVGAVNTYSGRIEVLKNRFDELKEKIGRELLPVADQWMGWINRGVSAIGSMIDAQSNDHKGRQLTIDSMSQEIAELHRLIAGHQALEVDEGGLYERRKQRLQTLTAAREREIAALQQERSLSLAPDDPKSKPAGNTAEMEKADKDLRFFLQGQNAATKASLRERLEDYNTMNMEKASAQALSMSNELIIDADFQARKLQQSGQYEAARMAQAQAASDSRKILEDLEMRRAQAVSVGRVNMIVTSMNQFAALSNAKSKELQAVAKAAAVAMALAGAYMSFASIASTPWWIAPYWITQPLAYMTMAAGIANAAMIAGLPLAEGGMVPSRAGGVSAIMAEAGHDEVAIPLDDERTKERLRDTFSVGGGIVVQVGTLIADDLGLDQFVRKLDEKLYKMGLHNRRLS